MKIKIFTLFVALLTSSALSAYDFQSGDLYYNITSDTTVEVTSKSSSYPYNEGVTFTTATIPETVTNNGTTYSVTRIGEEAFAGCSSLTSVTIGNSVTSIGRYAFEDCSSLTSITIPNSVTSIGDYAFSNCSSLPVENNLRYADTYLVEAVDKTLSTYSIKEGTKWIGNYVFAGCSSLTSLTIPNSVTSIGRGAFAGCSSLTSVTIPNSVTSIGEWAFNDCFSLTSVTIPNSVTSIEDYAFYYCSSLTSITCLGTTPPTLGTYVFNGTKLSAVYIPDNTLSAYQTAWGNEYAFVNNETTLTLHVATPGTLSDLIFDAGTRPALVAKLTLTGTLNDADFTCMRETMTSLVDVDLSGITNTSGVNFNGKENLLRIILPTNLTSIEDEAFAGCSSLTSVTIPNSVTSIGDDAFFRCSSLTSITIPNSVTSIGDEAFDGCSSLTSVTIPNSVTSIEDEAFSSCSSLTSVTIPNSVTSIGNSAFYGCSSLVSMAVESGNTKYDSRDNCNAIIETATNILIAGCQNTIIPNSVTSIGNGAFSRCSSLTSITIPNSVTSIGEWAFSYCESLTSITIPNSVTSIEDYAFEGCSSLTSITIPNSVTSIGKWAFYDCSSLTSITIPNSVTSIGNWAFHDCDILTTVICEATEVPELGADVFEDMPLSEATLYVPAQSLENYKAAEQWKDFGTILPLDKAPSAVENTRLPITNSTKLLRNGQLLILRDGKIYNAIGQEM